jgi:uncharacterized protein YbaR (Trm112 family)
MDELLVCPYCGDQLHVKDNDYFTQCNRCKTNLLIRQDREAFDKIAGSIPVQQTKETPKETKEILVQLL